MYDILILMHTFSFFMKWSGRLYVSTSAHRILVYQEGSYLCLRAVANVQLWFDVIRAKNNADASRSWWGANWQNHIFRVLPPTADRAESSHWNLMEHSYWYLGTPGVLHLKEEGRYQEQELKFRHLPRCVCFWAWLRKWNSFESWSALTRLFCSLVGILLR